VSTRDNFLEVTDPNVSPEESAHPLAAWDMGVIRSRGLVLFRAYSGAGDEECAGPYYSLTPEQALSLKHSLDDALCDLATGSQHRSSH